MYLVHYSLSRWLAPIFIFSLLLLLLASNDLIFEYSVLFLSALRKGRLTAVQLVALEHLSLTSKISILCGKVLFSLVEAAAAPTDGVCVGSLSCWFYCTYLVGFVS